MMNFFEAADNILSNFQGWNGTLENAVDIVHENQIFFDELMTFEEFSLEQKQILQKIYEKQTEFMKYLAGEKYILKENIIQLSKKDSIGKNYVAQKIEPVFVDKDFN